MVMIKPRLAGLEAMYAQKPAGGTQVGAGAGGASAIVPGQRSLTRRVRAERWGEEVTHAEDGGGTPGEFQFLKSVTKVRRELLME